MRFLLFLLSYSLNPLILYSIPPVLTTKFLYYYTISSAFFSLLMLIAFYWRPSLKNIKPLVLFTLVIFIVAIPIVGDPIIWIAYPCTLLLGDYITTQSGSVNASNYYRILMVLSAVLFIILPDNFYNLILIRMAISVITVLFIFTYISKFHQLLIDSPLRWIATTYIFYSGTLLFIPIIGGDTDSVKFWYIGTQVGIGLILKQLDFSVRATSKNYKWIFITINAFVLIIPVVLLITYNNYVFFTMYLISISALLYLKNIKG